MQTAQQRNAARLAECKRKLAARDGKPGYEENVKAIRAEIERLERLVP